MDTILGIDLGTTNSAVSVIRNGKPEILRGEDNQPILPSVVAFDRNGDLLVGQTARNQAVVAPERTVRSVKRLMGQDTKIKLGEESFSPQEISAMILRTLKARAEKALGYEVTKAVITVPAFFNETQREATREAGELAGLEVVRIINEPTAATLVYEAGTKKSEKLLIYDLGGGTFDVSIAQIEAGVVEILTSHGDTHLGGDDFDELLLNHVCSDFFDKHEIELRDLPAAKSRVLHAVEEAKKQLSFEPFVTIAEEFIAEKDGQPLNLKMEISRHEYEELIEPLLMKTVKCIDASLDDANLTAADIDKIILVGGSSRTPMVHRILQEQLAHTPHSEVDPDLCVAMGAAVQGALISGADVGTVLVDITPHTLGIKCMGYLHGHVSHHLFSPIISRNTPLPASRSEVYYTGMDGQEKAEICVLQGEDADVRHNQPVGEFLLEGLNDKASQGNEILVRFDLDLDGILTVTAVERATSLEKKLTIENALSEFRSKDRNEAMEKLAGLFGGGETQPAAQSVGQSSLPPETQAAMQRAFELIEKSQKVAVEAPQEDADEIRDLIGQIEEAIADPSTPVLEGLCEQLEDIVFYLEDA